MSTPSPLYHRHPFPPALISHAVYVYFRLTLSYRAVEELLAVRGIVVSYATVRRWCLKFGHAESRRRRPAGGTWVSCTCGSVAGRTIFVKSGRSDGLVLDIFLQERRNQAAAEAFLRRLGERQPAEPQVVVTGTSWPATRLQHIYTLR